MNKMTFTKAYATYGARLRNVNWACSAITKDGSSLVFSCLHERMRKARGLLRYTDNLERWANKPGRNLARKHLAQAHEEQLPVRVVIAKSDDAKGENVKRLQYQPFVRVELIGKVVAFDGDKFVIEFPINEREAS